MYRIIGADGKSYGPVPADQLRQWIREGRASGRTQVQADGSADWRPASSFPELTAEFGPNVLNPPPRLGPGAPPVANRANNKVAAGVCGIILGGLGIHKFILGYTNAGLIMLLVNLLTCGFGGIVMHVIGIIEGITYLTKSDEDFVRIYVDGCKEWF